MFTPAEVVDGNGLFKDSGFFGTNEAEAGVNSSILLQELRAVKLAQNYSLDFAGGSLGEFGCANYDGGLGGFIRGEAAEGTVAAGGKNLVNDLGVAGNGYKADFLTQANVGKTDGIDLIQIRIMFEESIFDGQGGDEDAAFFDDFLSSADHKEKPTAINSGPVTGVAGVEPVEFKRLLISLRVVKISRCNAGAADADVADFASR